jgi:predicted amidophosphoribosyltransferase
MDLTGKSVVVNDDVMISGATLDEFARTTQVARRNERHQLGTGTDAET